MKEENKEQTEQVVETQEVVIEVQPVEQPVEAGKRAVNKVEIKVFNIKSFQDSLMEAAEYFRGQYGETRNSLNSDITKELYKLFTKINQV